ncbi:MAG: ribose-phosphate diphosphokinase, partial [Pseudomonas sp.]
MHEEIPLLFGLQGSGEYAARVALQLHSALAEHEEREFDDGEFKARPLEPVRDREAVVVHSLYADEQRSVHDKLCRLLFFCAALKDAGARRVTALTPYLCYARKERRTQAQDPIISRYVAGLMESCGIDQVITLEVHDLAAFENAYRIPTQALSSAQLFADFFAPLVSGQAVVAVSPDPGGSKRAELFRQALEQRSGQPVGSAYMEKHRSNETLRGSLLTGEVRDKLAIIVDDLIST